MKIEEIRVQELLSNMSLEHWIRAFYSRRANPRRMSVANRLRVIEQVGDMRVRPIQEWVSLNFTIRDNIDLIHIIVDDTERVLVEAATGEEVDPGELDIEVLQMGVRAKTLVYDIRGNKESTESKFKTHSLVCEMDVLAGPNSKSLDVSSINAEEVRKALSLGVSTTVEEQYKRNYSPPRSIIRMYADTVGVSNGESEAIAMALETYFGAYGNSPSAYEEEEMLHSIMDTMADISIEEMEEIEEKIYHFVEVASTREPSVEELCAQYERATMLVSALEAARLRELNIR